MVIGKGSAAAAITGVVLSAYELFYPFLPKDVPPGDIGFVYHNSITSRDFFCCSAVIVDYNDRAVMAHALPQELSYNDDNFVDTGNVVEKIVSELAKRAIPLDECTALVDAGEENGLHTIVNNLQNAHIEIKEQVLADNSHPKFRKRTISYDPRTDTKKVKYY